jgi:hypothetical protein
MKHLFRFEIVVWLACSAFLSGQSNPPPVSQKAEPPADASDQKPQETYGPLDVLSDTMGVNFGPYLQKVLHDVRANWYNLIPESAKSPNE